MPRILIAILLAASAAAQSSGPRTLPYRFLLVIGNQWEDEASYLIERPGEFQSLAALLQAWNIPFDILRLDQQAMDRYHLLDRDGRPLYGTVIWDAPADQLKERKLGMLQELTGQGVGLIVMGDTVAAPEVAELTGLRYVSEYKSYDTVAFGTPHFITRGAAGREKELLAGVGYSLGGSKVTPAGTTVIATRGSAPFLTARQLPGGGRVAWLGIDRSAAQLQNQLVRDLLKRSLVWAQGYAVYPEYERAIILFMDDPGTPDKTFLSYWHYRTPTEEELRTGMIEPLQRRKGTMDVNVVTGYVDRKTERVINPWRQRVTDELDGKTIHDFASTKRGLDAGRAAGVFHIQSHGWTHMLPDLDSPPGPFWTAPIDGVASLDWYNEFGDGLRKKDVPAIVQRQHMQRALECIREDFGTAPEVVRPGGGLYSRNPAHNTAVNAARMGFGIATWNWAEYLSPERVLSLEGVSRRGAWEYNRRITAADIPWSVDAPYWLGFHDRDLALDKGAFERLLQDLGEGVRYMNGSEYSAYLHTRVRKPGSDTFTLAVDYGSPHCAYFAAQPSRWTVHFSDEARAALKLSAPEKQVVEVPAGTGTRVLWSETRK